MRNYISPNEISFGDVDDLKKISELIRLDEPYNKGGLPLYSNTSEMLVSTSDTHSLILGTTGSRKTRSVVFPMVLNIASAKEKQSMIVHDTKGDVPKYTYDYLKKQGYDVYVLNFRDPSASDHYNIFDSVTDLIKRNKKKANRKLGDICYQLFEESLSSEKDPYWLSTVSDYFAGLYEALCVFSNYNKRHVTFSNLMTFHRIIKNGGTKATIVKYLLKEKNHPAIADSLSSVIDNASDTKKNLLSMVNNPFNTFESISPITYKSDFTAKDLATKPTCVFIVTPDESTEFNFMVSLIVKEIYGELLDYATTQKVNTLPVTVHFLIDEFGSLPKIDSFNSMISAARSRNIRFHLILQTFSQLRQVYSEFGAANIFNNCESCICMRSNDYELEEVLRRSVGKMTLLYSNKEVELISNGILRTLDKGQAIILAQGIRKPIMVRLPDISEYDYEVRYSDCLDRKRKNNIPEFDFSKIFEQVNIEARSDEEIANKLIKEFEDRKEEIASYHKQKYPVMITENLRRLPSERYDIIIETVTYGKELSMYEALSEITHAPSKEIAVKVSNLSDERDEILLRCQNKRQFQDAIDRLKPLGRIKYHLGDGNNSSELPFKPPFII